MNRRNLLEAAACAGAGTFLGTSVARAGSSKGTSHSSAGMNPSLVRCDDGTALYVQDIGKGRPVVFVSAWTLDSRFWGTHIAALSTSGFRCIAVDRRGHGRSEAPSSGYDADTLASDLRVVLDHFDVHDAILVSHSIGGGESVRYLAKHGSERVSKLVLVAPTTPYIVKTEDNPEGVPANLVDGMLQKIVKDFPKWVADNEAPFFTPETVQETRTWIKNMMLGVPLPLAINFREQAGKTDFREDCKAVQQPTLIIHGDKDASAPLPLTGARTAKLIRNANLIVYEGAPHALPLTHRERFLDDVLRFTRG